MADKKLLLILFLSSLCFATSDNCLQWKMDDSADNNIVIGNDVNGEVIGANSVDINSTCNGFPAFHLNGTSQYVCVTIPYILPSARDNLWTKDPRNPVLSDATYAVSFGQLCKNPVGGWYFFGSKGYASIWRWESTDLVTWSNPVQVLAAGGTGKWDELCQVASVFQKPDGSWIMLYRGRGYGGVLPTFQIGKATATDSNAFTRIDNGGVNDGLFPQFGNNYDPTGIILVGDTYYVYVNGDARHADQNVYTSTDFETFTAWPGNPIFLGIGAFCSHIWHYNNYYYLLSACDFVAAGTTLYDHAIGLYRSTKPTFDANSRDFLGYPIINDQTYDVRYLDTPNVPTTDVYRTTYAPEFGDILYCIYDGMGSKPRAQCLASTSLGELEARTPKVSQLYGEKQSYSFWVQFDTLTDGDAVFSVGSSASDSSPVWLCVVKTKGADKVLSLFLGGGYRLSTTALDVNTPYHIVIVESIDNIIMYINGATAGFTFTQNNVNTDDTYLYIGAGYKREFLDGYIWDFRIYPTALTATEVVRLYNTGSVCADLSGDCCVNFVDFAILGNQWLQAPGVPSADIAPEGGDGVVNFLDLAVLVSQWLQCGDPCDPNCQP